MTLRPIHVSDTSPDEDGWWWASCSCGWTEGPFPGRTDAKDALDDHQGELS
jgi:hypothetical protein